MKKRILLVILYLTFLTGCAKLEMNYVFDEVGNVTASYIFAIHENSKADEASRLIDAALMQANDNGFTTTAYNEKGYIGFKAEKTISGVDYRNSGNEVLGFSEMPSIFKDFTWHYTPEIFRSKYRFRLNVDLKDIINVSDLDALPSDMKTEALKAIEQSKVTIHITLPGDSVESNADEIRPLSAKRATKYIWNLSVGQAKMLMIDAELDKNKTRDMVYASAAAAAALIILVSALIAIKSFKKNRKPAAH